jgi:gamma-glutamyltranspeptidase/glutathione hydrolase
MTRPLHTVKGRHGIVTAPHYLAAQAGLGVLEDGGSAAQATITVAATLAVVYPHMTGIGGDGFWLIRESDGRLHGVHGVGAAAAKADLGLYAGAGHDVVPWRGPLAANTVAGTLSAWQAVLETELSPLPLSRLLAPAIALAEEGVVVTAGHAAIAAAKGPELRVQGGAYASVFEPEGRPLREGDVLRQPALARTLRRLAEAGVVDFYDGALAADVAADLAELGSPVSAADLAAHRASRPTPLSVATRAGRLYNSAPPTQGVASLLILALAERSGYAAPSGEDFAHVHALVEATKQAFLWRDVHCGDPAYMAQAAQDVLDDEALLDSMAAKIDPARALPWPQPSQAGDTCWFGAIDGKGQVVSAIQSTYFEFGSGLVLPRTGITWQNRGPRSVWRKVAGMPSSRAACRSTRSTPRWLNWPMAGSWPMARWAARGSPRRRRRSFRAMSGTGWIFRRRFPRRAGCWAAPGARTAPRSRSRTASTRRSMPRWRRRGTRSNASARSPR